MIFVKILLGLLLLIVLLLILPLHVTVRLVDNRLLLSVGALFVRVRVYPRKTKRGDKPKKRVKKAEPSGKKKVSPGEIFDLLQAVLPGIPRVFGAIRIPRLHLRLRLAAQDAALTAELYGAVCAAFGCLWPHISRIFSISRPCIDIEPDFAAEKTDILLFADIRSCLAKLAIAALPVAFAYLKLLIKKAGGKQDVSVSHQ